MRIIKSVCQLVFGSYKQTSSSTKIFNSVMRYYNVGFNVVHRLTFLFYNRHVLEKDNDRSWITKYLTLKKLYREMNVIKIDCFLFLHPCSKMYRYIATLYFMISIKYSNYEQKSIAKNVSNHPSSIFLAIRGYRNNTRISTGIWIQPSVN